MRMRNLAISMAPVMVLVLCMVANAETQRLTKTRYLDKCRGAWAGQMIGVCYGAPYEFHYMGEPITKELEPWKPDRVRGAVEQDDCYVEMTFLKAIEDHGLDISFEDAGRAFAATEYPLWHANRAGRDNIRLGIMPPASGHPRYNRHADDIDFQIEADLFGIICPGLPQESNRLCNVFGHVINYGDGVYGGMFVAGMYAAAYFENEDVRAVVESGLRCIPPKSQYSRCIADVIRWHDQYPDDWLATWRKVEDKWQDDVDCWPGHPFNIDAKLNGAYIVIGLLYGGGDMLETIEIATRCGQDADCNPSNAAGIVGCMKGYDALGDRLVGGIPAIEDNKFLHTDYSFKELIAVCQTVAEDVVRRAGGKVEANRYLIPKQRPVPPEELEQWRNQEAILSQPIPPDIVKLWDERFEVVACGHDMSPGLRAEQFGREKVLVIHPVSEDEPAVIKSSLAVPEDAGELAVEVASDKRGDFVLEILVDGRQAKSELMDTNGKWRTIEIDLAPFRGKTVAVRIENHANNWQFEAAYLATVKIR